MVRYVHSLHLTYRPDVGWHTYTVQTRTAYSIHLLQYTLKKG